MSDKHDIGKFDRDVTLALNREWLRQSFVLFGNTMKPPHIMLASGGRLHGAWILETRCIEISRALVESERWGVVVEVLKHEMAHQFVHEVLRVTDESAHGPAFRSVCVARGIDARAKGVPVESASDTGDGVRRRIAKLLALAGSPNEHEAASAASLARKLRLRHRIEACTSEQVFSWKQLGPLIPRMSEVDRWLAIIMKEHAFVSVIFVQSFDAKTDTFGRVLEVCGTDDDLEFAEWMYVYLRRTAERLACDHVRRQGGGRRVAYMAGVLAGVYESLESSSKAPVGPGDALVWKGDTKLDAFLATRHPRIRTTRGSTSAGSRDHHAGREAGRRVVIHRPLNENRGTFGGFLTR